MNWLDVLIVLPVLVGLVRGLMRGFISEIIAFVVVILGVLGARLIAPPFSAGLLSLFDWPEPVCDVVAYTLVFLFIAIGLAIAAKLLKPHRRSAGRHAQIRTYRARSRVCDGSNE